MYIESKSTDSELFSHGAGVYCGLCGRKMYHDGNMWRCPHCHDSW